MEGIHLINAPLSELVGDLFVIPLPEEGQYCLYAPLRHTAVIINAAAVNLLADLKQQIAPPADVHSHELIEFLTRLELIDGRPVHLPADNFDGDPKPNHITLFLTTACNLRCTYCYASAGDTTIENMSLSTAKAGIDRVIQNVLETGKKSISLAYHGGGEPSVNWRVLQQSFEYAQQQAGSHKLRFSAGMASNGVFKHYQREWIVQNMAGCSISYDGLPVTQDLLRPMASGGASSERVAETLEYFDQWGFTYSIRMTVTTDQIRRLPDSVCYILDHFKPQNIQVEPAYQMGRWQNAPSAETDQFIAAYREANQIASRFNQSISFSAARAGTATRHFCGITQDNFSLTPNGNVSACFETFSEESKLADYFIFGKKDDDGGFSFEQDKLDRLRGQTGDRGEFCEACFARWSCAGDCHHKNRLLYGDQPFAGSDRCHIIRELTLDQILQNIKDAGGIVWKQ